MKEELKTLEDFKPEGKYGGVDVEGQSIRIPHWMLKQEAIKHIKECDYFGEFKENKDKIRDEWLCKLEDRDGIKHFCPKCEWIMHFFNIEESDLK